MNYQELNFQPVIIVGAARSGTNMIRDLLVQCDRVATWPCDEINYLWRYGNAQQSTDELQPYHARQQVVNKIRSAFINQAARTRANWLVEKTCANSLRVPFVDQVIPEAKYVFLVRDGVDVVASAIQRWHAPLDLRYVARKAAYIPMRDLPYYMFRYLGHRMSRLLSQERRLPTWGPRFEGMQEQLQRSLLPDVCSVQWKRSVEDASEALAAIPSDRVCFVRYESFVEQPARQLQNVLNFLQVETSKEKVSSVASQVSAGSVGKGRKTLPADKHQNVHAIVESTLQKVNKQWRNSLAA